MVNVLAGIGLSADSFALVSAHNALGGSREDGMARFDRPDIRYSAVYRKCEFHEGEALTQILGGGGARKPDPSHDLSEVEARIRALGR